MRTRASLLFIIATTGCMNEYHPEYHPVTTTTFVQSVAAPTTVVNESAPSSLKMDLPPQYDALVPAQPYVDPEPQIEPKTALITDAQRDIASWRSGGLSLPRPQIDPPPQAPGTYLGPNVQIGSGVTFNGNVYVQGNLIIGGTRAHPVLTTAQ